MSLKSTIDQDIKDAMRSKDQVSLRALRAIKSQILLAETAGGRKEEALSEAEEMKLLAKQAKQRKDSWQQFKDNGRDDLAEKEKEELEVIEKYLPKALSTEEIEAEVKKIIEQTGASSMKDMGKVMGMASKAMAGKADGKAISQIVKQILS
ncbi:MAG: GatB/YqeY domain-containing protein [Bacteroidia bacterium]|nr:GatB/YqeY domain-containing protein [Bacteroidia bacterium]